jgi:hypothetical protein
MRLSYIYKLAASSPKLCKNQNNMKNSMSIILGIFLSIFSIFFVADYYENGDKNAVLMYLIIYSFPLIILSLLNGFALQYAEKKNKLLKIFIFAFLPISSIILLFTNDISLRFLGTIGIITYGITNMYFYFKKNFE